MKGMTGSFTKRKSGPGESGTALVLALFLITVLTVLGTMVLNTSIVEIKMAGNQKVSSQVFYAAEAGLERGLLMLINDFQNDTTAGKPWGNANYAGWAESVTQTVVGGSTTFDPDVRSLAMYMDGSDPNLYRLTLSAGQTVNVCQFELYIYKNGNSEAWVMSRAFGNGGIAAVEYHLSVDNVSPYNNVIFTGAGIGGKFNGSVNAYGSMYSRGDLNPGAAVEIHNFYGGPNHPGNAMPSDFATLLSPVTDLQAKIRVKGGDFDIANPSTQVGSSYVDTGTGTKGSLAGIYVDGSTNIDSTGGPHYYDDLQSEVPDVPMPSILDGMRDQFGSAFIDSCIATEGYSGQASDIAASLYADWVGGDTVPGCWDDPTENPSIGVVFDVSEMPAGHEGIISRETPSFVFSDGNGNSIEWIQDPTSGGTLNITGNVVINGDLKIGDDNGQDDIEYNAVGDHTTGFSPNAASTLFCNGNIQMAGQFGPNAGTSGYLNPGSGINSLGIVTPDSITFTGGPSNYFTGFFYAEGQVNFLKQAALAGTVIAGYVDVQNVPDVYQVPNLKDYLPKAIPGGSDVFRLQNREWRRVY